MEAAKNFFGGSAGQQRVSDIFLKTLNIPLPPKHIQNKFVELWNETKRLSIEKKLEAQNLLDSINDYLLTELDIKVPDVDNSLSNRIFTVQASELSGGRFDAYRNKVYFQELQKVLGTDDVACVIDAKHLCVNSRGIRDIESSTVTAEFGGKFKEDITRKEFLNYIQLDTKF